MQGNRTRGVVHICCDLSFVRRTLLQGASPSCLDGELFLHMGRGSFSYSSTVVFLIQIRSREGEGGELEKSQSTSQVMQTLIVFVIPLKEERPELHGCAAEDKAASIYGKVPVCRTKSLQPSGQSVISQRQAEK